MKFIVTKFVTHVPKIWRKIDQRCPCWSICFFRIERKAFSRSIRSFSSESVTSFESYNQIKILFLKCPKIKTFKHHFHKTFTNITLVFFFLFYSSMFFMLLVFFMFFLLFLFFVIFIFALLNVKNKTEFLSRKK